MSEAARAGSGGAAARVSVLVRLAAEDPPAAPAAGRAARYAARRAATARGREGVRAWLAAAGLADEATLGAETAFDLLVVDCSPRVARRLAEAPAVAAVLPLDAGAVAALDEP